MKSEVFVNISATLLEALVALAKVPTDNPGKGAIAKVKALTRLLEIEDRKRFNENMSSCVRMISVFPFNLTPQVVATNILPHYANFIASQLANGLAHYTPHGVPVEVEFEIDGNYNGTATVQWAYSMVDFIEDNVPPAGTHP